MGYQTPVTIKRVVENIQSNQYVLPAIQREFVWKPDQIEKLFDSLLKDYPIGIFLFWHIEAESLSSFQFYRFMDRYHQRDHFHNEPIDLTGDHDATAVLDGQQRLTALNVGLRGWYARKLPHYHWSSDYAFPKRRLYLDLMGPSNDPEKEFEFSFLRDKDIGGDQDNHERHWFPVGNVLRFGEMQEPFEYCIDRGLTEGGLKFPYQTLMKLWKVVHEDRVIHYFLEEEQNLDKVLNIFIRVNSGGTELSYSDLLLSIAIAQWRELDAREEIYGLVDELNSVGEGFDFSKDFVLKACLVLSDTQQIEFRVDSFNRENMVRVENEWPDISRSIKLAVNLASSWGFSRQTLVSANALIPLAYYVHKQGHPPGLLLSSRWEETREQMRKWLMVVLLKRTFSGHTDTVLRSIRRAIQEDLDGFPINRISEELAGTSKSLTFDDAEVEGLLGYQYSQSYTFSVLALLYPWLKYDQQFHIDHVYPRSMFTERRLSEAGIPEERWPAWLEHTNDLANLQLLQGLPNQEKSDQAFEQWLEDECREPFERQEYLKLHMIPEVDLRFENFPEFCEARERMIRKRLEEIVAM